ncbi:MAG: alanine racemase [Gammaproteobacteria bacterium]
MSYTTTAHINLDALQHNVARVKELAPDCRVVGMVKAMAYGHGLLTIAHALESVDALGVARIHEALQLRKAGIKKPIVLMEGFFETWELPIIVEHQLDLVIHQVEQLHALTQARLASPIHVWLKLDSGMHRLGLPPDQFIMAWQALHKSRNVKEDIILMTHFASADELDNDYTNQQIKLFNAITRDLPGPRSLANSAAIMQWPTSHGDWVRPGIMLYGISPFTDKTGTELGLQPVMTLQSRVLSIHQQQAGDAIGYGGTFICPENMPIALVAIGYGDGYPRYIPTTGTPVLVNDQLTQVLGRVSMDMICVDLRNIQPPHLGDRVTLWGDGLPVEHIARAANTSPYELVCGVTSRVEFE